MVLKEKVSPKFSQEVLTELLEKYKNEQTVFPSEKSKEIMDFVCSNKFLSCIIDEKYGGKNLSVTELSSLLTKISSNNPALGVVVMVPNSLGPGELLQHYGTETAQRSCNRFYRTRN